MSPEICSSSSDSLCSRASVSDNRLCSSLIFFSFFRTLEVLSFFWARILASSPATLGSVGPVCGGFVNGLDFGATFCVEFLTFGDLFFGALTSSASLLISSSV